MKPKILEKEQGLRMRGYRKEWLKGEVALVPLGMMEGKRNLSLLDLRLWVNGGDSIGFEVVDQRWRHLGWPADGGDRRVWDQWELGFFVDFGAPQQLISNS